MLLALWAAWLGSLGIAGIVAYREVFHFDAADGANWAEVRRLYLSGATIPFDFAAIAAALPILGVIGCVVLSFRLGCLGDHLFGLWPIGFLPSGLSVSAVFQPRRLGRARGTQAVNDALGMIVRLVHFVWSRGRLLIRPGRFMVRKSSQWDASEISQAQAISKSPEPPAAVEERESGDPLGIEARPGAAAMTSALPSGQTLSLFGDAKPEEPVASASADVSLPASAPIDEDYAVFGRIMALFEVWSDPTPDWMREALREELDKLSEFGWTLFANFGEPAMACLDTLAKAGLLPLDPAKLALAQELLERRRKQHIPAEILAAEIKESLLESAMDDGTGFVPKRAARLSMNAAWLCEMADNFVMLEEIRAAGDADGGLSFENRWGAIYRETGERLKVAMQTMTDQDWGSIDQFPDRAGRIRVLTDRLREDLRILPIDVASPTDEAIVQTSSAAPVLPLVSAVSVPVPEILSPDDEASAGIFRATSLEEVLRAAGYVVRPLPAMRGPIPGESTDYLAQRDDFSVLLRLADLSGGAWTLDGDSLAPWRGGEGTALPSPCRAVWQRLALLRSLDRETKPCAGVVVLRGGHFTDEQAVASIIKRDRRRTDVDLAWLDRTSSNLPDLPAWLIRVAATRSKTDSID